jgi:hypothetical protein
MYIYKSIIFSLLFLLFGVWTQDFTFVEQVFYHLSHASCPSCSGHFGDRVILSGLKPYWPQIIILPISATQAAKSIGMNHCQWPEYIFPNDPAYFIEKVIFILFHYHKSCNCITIHPFLDFKFSSFAYSVYNIANIMLLISK